VKLFLSRNLFRSIYPKNNVVLPSSQFICYFGFSRHTTFIIYLDISYIYVYIYSKAMYVEKSKLLSCMHWAVQLKSLSWWGEVGRQFTYIPTAPGVEYPSGLRRGIGASGNYILFNYANQDSNSRPLTLYWVACTDQFNPKT